MEVTLSPQMYPSRPAPMVAQAPSRQPSQVSEDILMDVHEVKNFLYMVVSSHIRVDGNNGSGAHGVNTLA